MVTFIGDISDLVTSPPGAPSPPPVTREMTRPLESSFEKCVFQRFVEQSECLLPGTKFKHELDSRERVETLKKERNFRTEFMLRARAPKVIPSLFKF